MWLAALILLAVGAGDLVRPREANRKLPSAAAGVALGAVVAALAVAAAGTPWPWLAAPVGVALVWALGFTYLPERLGLVPIAVLAVAVLGCLAFPAIAPAAGGMLADWYAALPYDALAGTTLDRAALLVAYSVFLLQSANRVVVAVLALTDARLPRTALQLKGGRIIGPLERLFILWMAVGGQALAVGAVIAAKGILRYPEIRESARGGSRGVLAEYVLVGSLVSWGVALLVVPVH